MMWTMKYIMTELAASGGPAPIIFPAMIKHVHMAHDIGFPVRSAGWMQIDKAGAVTTYGEATSLDLKPHPDDTAIIDRWLRDRS